MTYLVAFAHVSSPPLKSGRESLTAREDVCTLHPNAGQFYEFLARCSPVDELFFVLSKLSSASLLQFSRWAVFIVPLLKAVERGQDCQLPSFIVWAFL
jgi:hypothetical protein